MIRALAVLCVLSVPAVASTIAISGDCSANCSLQLTDQFGNPWGSVSADVGPNAAYAPGPIPGQYPILGQVSGDLMTTLDLTAVNAYAHSDATGPDPFVALTATITIPDTISLVNVYLYEQAWTDECPECAPGLQVAGLGTATPTFDDNYRVYSDIPNPGEITLTSNVSTVIDDSTDWVMFYVGYSDPPTAVPEPGGFGILTGLVCAGCIAGKCQSQRKTRQPILAEHRP